VTPAASPFGGSPGALAIVLHLFGQSIDFTVWDVFGVLAQIAFTWRVLHQWVASERQGRSHVPLAFWSWSLVGSVFDLVYCFGYRDPVLASGALVTGTIFARNWWMARTPANPSSAAPGARQLLLPIVAGVLLFTGVIIESFGPDHGLVKFDRPNWPWLVLGFIGTIGWTARFVVQWFVSERRGESHLPPAFFSIGLASCLLLLVYTVSQGRWVKVLAFAFTVIPYARNLVLLRRHRPPTAPTVGDPGGAAAAAEAAAADPGAVGPESPRTGPA
jgi:lipid-A-disaccharide synthase-like uncharacterized protein